MSKEIIWRDDDISKKTDLKRFKKIHNLFLKYGVVHTVALICSGIENNKSLIKYLQKQHHNGSISIQVHCWEHYHLLEDLAKFSGELPKCIEVIEKYFVTTPTILFPPWNESNSQLEHIAKMNGLTVLNKKMSISGYLKGQSEAVVNFHSWAEECDQLEDALKVYTNQ